MVALPAFKLVFLGIRQLTRPIAKRIVARATSKHGITYSMCIGLGRVSLGMSGVIAEWSGKEARRRSELQKRAGETEGGPSTVQPKDDDGGDGGGDGRGHRSRKTSGTAEEAASAAASSTEKEHVVTLPRIVTPRSRSLLEPIMYGPAVEGKAQDDNADFLVSGRRTPGAVMRVLIVQPYQSAWHVFKASFLAPFPEKRLVDAGADFMIELIAYTVLALLLVIEMRQASRSASAKEEHVNARLDAIEEKINELVRTSSGAAQRNVEELPPVPELKIRGRLDSLSYLFRSTYKLVEGLVVADPHAGPTIGGGRRGEGAGAPTRSKAPPSTGAEGGAALVPLHDKRSLIPKVSPPDPQAKRNKHDESATMKAELAKALASGSKTA